ncbi:hypothetical protein HY025_00515 [Candidatus Daviesbacteria bacterium]|nr:hypothetical protein [Candidatus Daviesbacteria bacterium]
MNTLEKETNIVRHSGGEAKSHPLADRVRGAIEIAASLPLTYFGVNVLGAICNERFYPPLELGPILVQLGLIAIPAASTFFGLRLLGKGLGRLSGRRVI